MKGFRITETATQINDADPETVFPLLCPVREKDWLDGWDYNMVYSQSGVIEKGCIFTTPNPGKKPTVWYVTEYDKIRYKIEFVRVFPDEEVVKISIKLSEIENELTKALITYEFTPMNEPRKEWMKDHLHSAFAEQMQWWEKSINYYLKHGKKLLRTDDF